MNNKRNDNSSQVSNDNIIDINEKLASKSGNSFVQNPDHNDESHKEGMGRNTKR